MVRLACVCGLVALAGGLLVAAAGQAPRADDKKPAPLTERLYEPVDFPGFDDPKMTVKEALAALEQRYGIQIDVNEAAFRQILGDRSVLQEVVAPVPPMSKVSLATALRKVLSRINAPPGNEATFLVRRDGKEDYHLEVLTWNVVQAEVWGRYPGPFLPLVSANFTDKPLAEALQSLADRGGFNVVLDGRVADKAKALITARLLNVPLDTAVGMLADQADLKAFLVDNLLYVTTRENANRLEEQEKLRMQAPGGEETPRRAGSVTPVVPGAVAPGGA